MKGNEWSPEQVHPAEPAVLIVANRGPNSVTNTGPSPPALWRALARAIHRYKNALPVKLIFKGSYRVLLVHTVSQQKYLSTLGEEQLMPMLSTVETNTHTHLTRE